MGNHHKGKEFLVGAALGGLLGTMTALLIAPKAGKKLREDICDKYCDISESTQEMADSVTKKGKDFVKGVNCYTNDLSDKAKEVIGDIANWVHLRKKNEDGDVSCMVKDFAIGGLTGGVLGAALALLLAPKSGQEIRQDLVEKYEDMADTAQRFSKKGKSFAKSIGVKTTDWFSLAEDLVDQVSDKLREKGEEVIEKGREVVDHSPVKDLLNWASLGLKVWGQMKKKG